jgi:predicted amidohydrolase YtcJ
VENPKPSQKYTNHYRCGGVKLTIDGSPQGKTAWLTKPYFIPPPGKDKDYVGYAAIDEETTNAAVEKAYANGWQILCHGNGDAASDRYIAAIRKAKAKYPKVDNRPVLIHGQVLREEQVDELKELDIFPSLFPMHTFYWGDYHRDSVLGPERAANISPTGWVLKRGMMFGTHHDAPVALPDSMRILSATVTRKTRTGKVLGPEHKVPVATALKAMTLWSAWQHFEEKTKGSIEVGKLADFVVLSENPLEIDEDKIADIKVLETIKEGTSVYKRPAKVSSIATPALFGVTLNSPAGRGNTLRYSILNSPARRGTALRDSILSPASVNPFTCACGDGCFSHGLGVMLHAIESASESAP